MTKPSFAAGGSAASAGRTYDLQDRLIAFACRILDVVEALPPTKSGAHVSGQLVRCGTSPMANHAEAQNAESRKDFVHKMKIGLKELRETRVWLLVVRRKGLITKAERLGPLIAECDELISIFAASIKTAAGKLAP